MLLRACLAAAEQERQPQAVEESSGEASALSYRLRIEGLEREPELQAFLERISQLEALRERPPRTRAGVARRAEGDLERWASALRSQGFYGNELGFRIVSGEQGLTVVVTVSPGPLYLLADYEVADASTGRVRSLSSSELEGMGLYAGMAARAEVIVEADRRLLRSLKIRGHPFAELEARAVLVDHEATTVTVRATVDAGPRARFGETRFEGLETVEEDHLRRRIPWRSGDLYDERKVEAFRSRLLDGPLFAFVGIEHAASLGPDDMLPITVRVVEAKHRSIGAGASFSSSEGFGASAFWEHRNLLGRQESLRLSAEAAEIRQGLSARFRKPDFGRADRDLLASLAGRLRDTEAFQERTIETSVGLERRLGSQWRFSDAVSAEFSELDDAEGERTFALFGYSAGLGRDSTDDLLDPSRGTRLRATVTPYVGTVDRQVIFVVGEVTGSLYLPLTSDRRWVAAGRGRLGSIVGEATATLPASKRFYAGGGGSIRGFEFQSVGPLDAAADPLGGRSVVEVGAEIRTRLTESVGLVAFLDGGNVYDDSYPDLGDTIRWAAGLGARYFTAVGPLRLDIAFPLNPRSGVDNVFEFYVSLGQAF